MAAYWDRSTVVFSGSRVVLRDFKLPDYDFWGILFGCRDFVEYEAAGLLAIRARAQDLVESAGFGYLATEPYRMLVSIACPIFLSI